MDEKGVAHMRFGAHYLPTYVAHLDRSVENYYQLMFQQMEELERLGFDDLWVTEHHFSEYGGILPHPPTFLSAIARTTQRIRLGTAVSVLPLHSPFDLAESYGKFHVYVTDSLDQAVREAVPYLGNYYDIHAAADPDRGLRGSKEHDFASDMAGGFIIAGDPQRCIDSIRQWKEVGLTAMSGTFHFGGMPHELALKNIQLFAEQVMPAFNGRV